MRRHPDAKVTCNVAPLGSGMSAHLMYDSVYVSGSPDTPGVYQVTATVTDGARQATSSPVELRIYSNDRTLAQRFTALPEGTSSWDMEPYVIRDTGDAEVPTWLREIWGSHESGVYGQIGSGEKDYASETLLIPAGADVKISNMKISSSVHVVVCQGARLTLDNSVVYGPMDVYGTLSTAIESATTSTINMHEGSTLQDAQIKSHAHFLSDGSTTAPQAGSPVVVMGTVTIRGDVVVKGDEGTAGTGGQPAIQVGSGKLVLEEGSTLTARGGDTNVVYPTDGGAGVVLDGGTVSGPGTLVAIGGQSYEGKAGSGTVDVGSLVATGGNTAPEGHSTISGKKGTGGEGVDPDVKVRAGSMEINGGQRANPGPSEVTPYDPDTPEKPGNPEQPGNTQKPGGEKPSKPEAPAGPQVKPGQDSHVNGQANQTGKVSGEAANKQHGQASKQLPRTADQTSPQGVLAVVGGMLAAMGAGIAARMRTRRG